MTEELAKLPKIGHAQGLCYAFDSLYVVVSTRNSSSGCGVFRLLDTDGDDMFDKLRSSNCSDSRPASTARTPLFPPQTASTSMIGNQTKVPADYSHSRVPEVWGEDHCFRPCSIS